MTRGPDDGPGGPGPRPTLATVASVVGVSTMTVSNAYNRPEKLSAELRRRILATAATLGYPGPHPMARSLRRGRTGALGFVFGESLAYAFNDPGAVQFLEGVALACSEHGAGLYLVPTTGAGTDERLVQYAAVDAFLLFGLPDDHPLVGACLRRGLPVLTSGSPKLDGHPFVSIDERAAARSAAAHVLDLGHQAAGVVCFPFDAGDRDGGLVSLSRQRRAAHRVVRERLAGYRQAWAARGRRWQDVLVYEAPANTRQAGRDAALALFRASPGTTAVLAISDELALGVLDAAAASGRQVPADLSVVGWDDTPAAAASDPPLTTIRQSLHDQGRLIGQLALAGTPASTERMEPWSLVERSSTAPLPAVPTGQNRLPARPNRQH